jgi:hypothetical protein
MVCCAAFRRGRAIELVAFLSLPGLPAAFAQPFTNTIIALENQQAGTADWQLTRPALNQEIEGYASLTSVNRGSPINLFVNTTNSAFNLEVFRIGWYGGAGGRRMLGPVQLTGCSQSIPPMELPTRLVECNWTNPYTLQIPGTPSDPTNWPSGVYVAKLTGGDDGKQSYIIFAVRDDTRPADLLAQMSFNTYHAYNNWGGASLYDFNSPGGRASKVSFNRPFALVSQNSSSWVGAGEFFGSHIELGWECNLVRWLEREGYDVSYCSSVDTHSTTNLLWSHKCFISMGHDEYWSYPMRWNVGGARDRGVNLVFFSSNTCYRQVRYEPSTLDSTPNRTLVCYKSFADPVYYTSSNYLTTVNFRDPPVNDNEASLLGVSFDYIITGDMVVGDPTDWIFTNTGVAARQRLPGLLGNEVDGTNSSSPAGIQVAFASPYVHSAGNAGPEADATGSNSTAVAYSQATSYVAPSGATVFASGSMEWNFALDDLPSNLPVESFQNPVAQQITRNIFARALNNPPPSATLFFRTDLSTGGDWLPRYGADGWVLPNQQTNLPAYANLDLGGVPAGTYLAASSDTNSLQRVAGPGRYLAGWSSVTNFTMDLNLTDGANHQVAFYFWDWNNAGRRQLVEVLDATTQNLLDQRTIANFTTGQWWAWQVNGHVRFRFTSLAGPDCLANAIMFGNGAAAIFVGEDNLTQGNWQPFYGSDGNQLFPYSPLNPSYATVQELPGIAPLIASFSTTDPRALEQNGTTNRFLGAGSTLTMETVLVNMTDNAWHQLAVYCVDIDRIGRREEISVIDPFNNSVLDNRLLTDFGEGKYLVWNARGAVKLRFQCLGPVSAVVSGIFLGPPNWPPSVALTAPGNLAAFTLPTNIVVAATPSDSDGTISEVDFYANGALLGSATNAPFMCTWTNATVGQYNLVAVALDDRRASTASAPVSITVLPPANYQPPLVQVTSPADGSSLPAPVSLALAASVTSNTQTILNLQFLLDGAVAGPPLTNPPFTWMTGSLNSGVHWLQAAVTDAFGVVTLSASNQLTVTPANASALFRGFDFVSEGSWKGLYGADGYLFADYVTNLPPYALINPTGVYSFAWAGSTADRRALQKPLGTDRFAGLWFATNFVVDVNLVDGNAHQVSLYCLDWDNEGGVQTIQVLDAVTGNLLDTRTVTNFSSGAYLAWQVVGHVSFVFSHGPPLGQARLSGLFFDPIPTAPATALLTPQDGASFVAPANIQITALANSGSAGLTQIEFLANGVLLGAAQAGPPYTFTWTNPPPGPYVLQALAMVAAGSNTLSSPASINIETAGAAAFFVASDSNHQGDWLGRFGQQGYLVAGDSTNLPSFLSLNPSWQTVLWIGDTSDERAPQKSSGTSHIAAAWFSTTNLALEMRFTDQGFHRVTLYFVDWLNLSGTEQVDVLDFDSGALLDRQMVPGAFNGVYEMWNVKGHVLFRIARDWGPPTTLSGIFFDPSAILTPISISQPSDHAVFIQPQFITVSANPAADPNVTRVDFFSGTNLLGSVSNGPPYNFTWTSPSPGVQSLVAREVGPAGSLDSKPVLVYVVTSFLLSPHLLSDHTLRLDAINSLAQPVVLEATTNLGGGAAWVPLTTNNSGSNQFSFILTDTTNFPQRFYRMVSQ